MPVPAEARRPRRPLSVLVVGVEDALGRATIRHLEADGHQVITALVDGNRRDKHSRDPANVRAHANGKQWSPRTGSYDAVVFVAPLVADPCGAVAHLLAAPSRARHAKALATLTEILCTGNVPRLILRSSTSLYADHRSRWVTESGVVAVTDATEHAAWAERLAFDDAGCHVDSVTLRLAHLYGPGDAWTDEVLRLASKGWEPFAGPDDAYFPLIHIDDAARAVAGALAAPGGVYNVAECRPVTYGELNRIAAGVVGAERLHPLWPSIRCGDRDQLARSRRIDASRLNETIGWQASVAPDAYLGFAAVTRPVFDPRRWRRRPWPHRQEPLLPYRRVTLEGPSVLTSPDGEG